MIFVVVPDEQLVQPTTSTDLHEASDLVERHQPSRVVVVTDMGKVLTVVPIYQQEKFIQAARRARPVN